MSKLTKQIFQLRVYHDLSQTDPLLDDLCRFTFTNLLSIKNPLTLCKGGVQQLFLNSNDNDSTLISELSLTFIVWRLSCKYRSLDLCDVRDLPNKQVDLPPCLFPSVTRKINQSINVSKQGSRTNHIQIGDPVQLFPMLWRFFPTLDPQVWISHIFLFVISCIPQVDLFVSRWTWK